MTNEKITIKPMINVDAFQAAQSDFIFAVSVLFITSFFGVACVIGIVYRFGAIKATLGL